VRLAIRDWLLKQMNARDSLDGVTVTVKLAVCEFGPKRVARELRAMANKLEDRGSLPGWKFDGKDVTVTSSGRRSEIA